MALSCLSIRVDKQGWTTKHTQGDETLTGIVKRYIVTAYNLAGDAYRYMSETEEDAQNQVAIFTDMGLDRVSSRSVLWDTRKNRVV